ncbi:MAG: nucleotidyltransferase family protein, partial [Eubacteriales bacterium]
AGAEKFAFGGTDIVNRLGFIDELSFGSECGNRDIIEKTARGILSDEFQAALCENAKKDAGKPYGALYFDTYRSLFGDDGIFDGSNNILGVCYVAEIIKRKMDLSFSTLKRVGEAYNGGGEGYSSASTIREKLFSEGADAVREMLPSYSFDILENEYKNGKIAVSERLFAVFSSFLLSHSPEELARYAENDISLASRLIKAGNAAHSLKELFSLATTKKYSPSRIRRALLFSYFGITADMLSSPPSYTLLLAANEKGRELLAYSRKHSGISVITKPADYIFFGDDVKAAFELSKKAASLRSLSLENAESPADIMRKTPYIL